MKILGKKIFIKKEGLNRTSFLQFIFLLVTMAGLIAFIPFYMGFMSTPYMIHMVALSLFFSFLSVFTKLTDLEKTLLTTTIVFLILLLSMVKIHYDYKKLNGLPSRVEAYIELPDSEPKLVELNITRVVETDE